MTCRLTNHLVVIPAKGTSRGLPQKNLAEIGGEPLIVRAVRTSLAACSRVVVSTDSTEIAMAAADAGAYIDDRPAELATDDATSADVLRHVLQTWPCDVVALVQCTAPLLQADDIVRCMQAVTGPDMLAVAAVQSHAVRISDVATLGATNRQNRDGHWVIAGSVWAFQRRYLDRRWYSGRVVPVEQWSPWYLEIDTVEDLRLARALVADERAGVIIE